MIETSVLANLMREPLLKYYDQNKRVLPWREDGTAYRIWISEIMLQQTRVEAVKPYFNRFIEALPTIYDLAKVEQEVLLKLWEGLGYYNRARNLQKAAQIIVAQYNGQLPSEYNELLALPGIGTYTAGAIASIAFQKKVPAVDGNVLRVMTRICEDDSDVLSAKVKKDWEEKMYDILSYERPGDFNQAMMEIGAMVCIPKGAPKCQICPFDFFCRANKNQSIEKYPYKAKKKKRIIEEKTLLILKDEDSIILLKRPEEGLLAGMYEFPSIEGKVSEQVVIDYLYKNGIKALHIEGLEDTKHIFTHKEWHMKAYSVRVDELATKRNSYRENSWILVSQEEAREVYPIPSAYAAYMKYLDIIIGYGVFDKE